MADARRPSEAEETQSWLGYAGLGLEFIVAVGVMGLLGWWLDVRLHSAPWLMLVGVVVGFAAGLYRLIRVASKSFK